MKQLEVFDGLKEKRTFTFKSTLKDVIQSGIANLDSSVGVYAPEPEAYDVFAKLFDPIIKEYHGWGFSRDRYHPPSYFGDPNEFKDLDPEKEFIVSTRIRCGRSVVGFPFNPNMGAEDYVELEEKMIGIFTSLTGINYGGTYYALMGMQKEVQQRLIEDHFLFKEGDRFLQAANASNHWPTGRGIFHNEDKTFLIWVGEEDHLRIISMQKGGDVGEVLSPIN
ncbi:E2.7.3.3 [Lepeophtheirus salmonis]|uniref:arginine kinase n=1 Tax=Lepeophtheirus salmonis TaxID=72036 RepID=A0A7R8H5R2_LEPSM|nr:E2.7.3.3 [Lepeophtheirus salmonis]CAF2882538.1 E2.7.3.3 [Lepeophtheirus salmonis]